MANYTPQHIDSIFLDNMSGEFEAGTKPLMEALNAAQKKLQEIHQTPLFWLTISLSYRLTPCLETHRQAR